RRASLPRASSTDERRPPCARPARIGLAPEDCGIETWVVLTFFEPPRVVRAARNFGRRNRWPLRLFHRGETEFRFIRLVGSPRPGDEVLLADAVADDHGGAVHARAHESGGHDLRVDHMADAGQVGADQTEEIDL